MTRAGAGRRGAVRAYVPLGGAAPYPVVVWLHGGGWMLGSIETYARRCRRLADQSGALVLSVEYRLAPEHAYPAAVEDALAAVRWAASDAVAARGRRPGARRGSGGLRRRQPRGGRRAAAARRARPAPAGARLPGHRRGLNTPSFREFGDRFGLTARGMRALLGRLSRRRRRQRSRRLAAARRRPRRRGARVGGDRRPRRPARRGRGVRGRARARRRAGELRRWPGTIHGFIRWQRAAEAARDGRRRARRRAARGAHARLTRAPWGVSDGWTLDAIDTPVPR